MEDIVIVNVAVDIDELRDVILALMPCIYTTLIKRECEGCTLYHLCQTDAWVPWMKKQQTLGSTSVWQNVLVNCLE